MKLSRAIDWRFLEAQFGSVYSDGPGCPPLPTRLMAGLALLKHMYDLSDEALCDRRIENPYFQFFCGEEFFQHRLPFDRSSLTRWRQRMGEAKLTALIQESLSVATRTEAMKPKDLARVVVDTTMQPKAVMFPTDAKLLNQARERLVRLAAHVGVELRQSYARVGKLALIALADALHFRRVSSDPRSIPKGGQFVTYVAALPGNLRQQELQPSKQEMEVIPGGGQHGVNRIAGMVRKIIAAHAVLGLVRRAAATRV